MMITTAPQPAMARMGSPLGIRLSDDKKGSVAMGLIKVRYLGIADVRTISKKEWAGAGVTVDKDVEWSAKNGFSVVLDVNERMEEILRDAGHFSLSKLTDSGGVEVVAVASNPDAGGDTIVDASNNPA